MKKAFGKIGIAILSSLLSIVFHIVAVACAVASVPYLLVDELIRDLRRRLNVDYTPEDDSEEVPYLFDYMFSIFCYLTLSLLVITGVTYLVYYPLDPRFLMLHAHMLPDSFTSSSFAEDAFKFHCDAHSSGLLYTVFLFISGMLIEILDKRLFFIPELFLETPHKLISKEKCAVLLFDLLFISGLLHYFQSRVIALSVFSVFWGYFFWLRPDIKDIKAKLQDLLKIRVFVYYIAIMVVIFAIAVLKEISPALLTLIAVLLVSGTIMCLIAPNDVIAGLSHIRAISKWRWKDASNTTELYRISWAEKIGTTVSTAITAIKRTWWSLCHKAIRRYIKFRIRLRKLTRSFKKKTSPKPDNKPDSPNPDEKTDIPNSNKKEDA